MSIRQRQIYLNKIEIDKKKKGLIKKAELVKSEQTRQYIYSLIDILDIYLRKMDSGCNPIVMTYIENEINNIIKKMELIIANKTD